MGTLTIMRPREGKSSTRRRHRPDGGDFQRYLVLIPPGFAHKQLEASGGFILL
jgi:hypothetical protein